MIAIIAQLRASSTRTVLFHAAIAERLGLNPSDHKCADLLLAQPDACTPGRLAELTGLSTGAITGVLDRLERAGFVVREHDMEDRRRILLRVTERRGPDMQKLFAPLAAATTQMCERFSVEELETVLRFMRASSEVLEGATVQIRSELDALTQAGPPAQTTREATRAPARRPPRAAAAKPPGRARRPARH